MFCQELYRQSLCPIDLVKECLIGVFQGMPTTFLRIPFQPVTQAPPVTSATTSYLAQSTPVLSARTMMQQQSTPLPPPPYSAHPPAPIGWAVNSVANEHPTGMVELCFPACFWI